MKTFWFVVFLVSVIATLAHTSTRGAVLVRDTLAGLVAGDTVR